MSIIIIMSGASSGFGSMCAHALADAGHTVYAGLRGTTGRNADRTSDMKNYAAEHRVDLHPVELDVLSDESVRAAVATVLSEQGSLDVVFHNAGHMVTGPSEAFTTDEIAGLYDTNVLGTQRLNRAALPHLRQQGHGLLLWMGSSSTRGGTPPYLGPYFAAKAAMDSFAVSYAGEVARFGIDTTILVPGSFTTGTNHFANSGSPSDTATADAYGEKYSGLMQQISAKLQELSPSDADPAAVARAAVDVVGMKPGTRPFRVHIDPADDGAAVVNAVGDRIRAEFLNRIGLGDLLHPTPLSRS